MRKILFLLLLAPLFTLAQAPTSDSTKLTAPPTVTSFTPSSWYQRGGNASNAQIGYFNSLTGKWGQLVTGYQFNHYTGASTLALINAVPGLIPTNGLQKISGVKDSVGLGSPLTQDALISGQGHQFIVADFVNQSGGLVLNMGDTTSGDARLISTSGHYRVNVGTSVGAMTLSRQKLGTGSSQRMAFGDIGPGQINGMYISDLINQKGLENDSLTIDTSKYTNWSLVNKQWVIDKANSTAIAIADSVKGSNRVHPMASMGDSFTAAGIFPAQVVSLANAVKAGWIQSNYGISGDNTTDMVNRFNSILTSGAEYVNILGGVNDLVGGTSVATIEANLQSMYTMAHNAGIKVIANTICPFSGNVNWTSTIQSNLILVNNWILSTAINVDYKIDLYSVMGDPSNLTALNPIYNSGDGLHPNTLGYQFIGTTIYNGSTFTQSTSPATLSIAKSATIDQDVSTTAPSVGFKQVYTQFINGIGFGNNGVGYLGAGYGISQNGSLSTSFTGVLRSFQSKWNVPGNAAQVTDFSMEQGTYGGTVGAHIGLSAGTSNTNAGSIGFLGQIPAASTSYNIKVLSGAQNYFATNTGFGSNATPISMVEIAENTAHTTFTGTGISKLSLSNYAGTGNYTTFDFYSNNSVGNAIGRMGAIPTGLGSFLTFGTSNVYASGITNGNVIIDPTGKIGVGTGIAALLNGQIQTVETGSAATRGVVFDQISTDVNSPDVNIRKARGVVGALTAAVSGDNDGKISFWGHDGTNYQTSAQILSTVSNTVSAGIVPGSLVFKTATAAGALTTVLTLNSNSTASFASTIFGSLFNNATTANNASIGVNNNGISLTRNIADANTAVIVNQSNASSTGLPLDIQFGGVSKASFNVGGLLALNGTYRSSAGTLTLGNGGTTSTRNWITGASAAGNTDNWYIGSAIGTADGISNALVNDLIFRINLGNRIIFGNSTTPSLTIGNTGLLQFNQYTTPGILVNDASGNVTSSGYLSGSATLNFPSTVTAGNSILTITVTGATAGDVVSLGVDAASIPSGSFNYFAWVSAANTVSIQFNNTGTIGALDPASGTFKVKIFK